MTTQERLDGIRDFFGTNHVPLSFQYGDVDGELRGHFSGSLRITNLVFLARGDRHILRHTQLPLGDGSSQGCLARWATEKHSFFAKRPAQDWGKQQDANFQWRLINKRLQKQVSTVRVSDDVAAISLYKSPYGVNLIFYILKKKLWGDRQYIKIAG